MLQDIIVWLMELWLIMQKICTAYEQKKKIGKI